MEDRRETSTAVQNSPEEKLQESLAQYSFRIRELFLKIIKIKAAILAEEAVLDPKFDAAIIAAQTDYNGILQSIFTETVKSVKTVQGLSGAAGLVVGFIETSLSSMSKVTEVQKRVATTLEAQEKQAPLIKMQQLDSLYDEITAHEKEIDNKLEAFLNTILPSISHLTPENIQTAKQQATDLYRECLRESQSIKKEVQIASQKIDDLLTTSGIDVERHLARDIMSIHLTRGLYSASVVGPGALLAGVGHHFRKTRIRDTFRGSAFYRLRSLNEPSAFEWECLRAVLKRHPITDFDATNPEYYSFMKKLQMILYLIRKPERTLCENLNLCSALVLNYADKAALKEADLNQQLPVSQRFFSKSPYANNKHLALKDTLATLLAYTKYEENKQEPITKLQKLAARVIDFYVTYLIEQFLGHPLFQSWVETHRTLEGERELLALVVKIINNELGDKTASDYYKSFLCGMSIFCSDIGKLGMMQLEFSSDAKLTLNFSGCLSSSGEIEKQEIIYPGIQEANPTRLLTITV